MALLHMGFFLFSFFIGIGIGLLVSQSCFFSVHTSVWIAGGGCLGGPIRCLYSCKGIHSLERFGLRLRVIISRCLRRYLLYRLQVQSAFIP
jgi:hypothetical protein